MSSEPSMTDETRDDRGRLVSVVVDGQRFHRADDGQPCEPPTCDHHWVSSHQPDFPEPIYWVARCSMCGVVNGAALAEELAPLVAEVRSLRGVVQAVAQLHRRIVLSNGVEVDYCACGKRNCSTVAALAAAADAPQPEGEQRRQAHPVLPRTIASSIAEARPVAPQPADPPTSTHTRPTSQADRRRAELETVRAPRSTNRPDGAGAMTTAQQWREAAIELRRQAEIFEETARMVESLTKVSFPALCAVVCPCGPHGEPLACAYVEEHDGAHSWASLPTWAGPSSAVLPEKEQQR